MKKQKFKSIKSELITILLSVMILSLLIVISYISWSQYYYNKQEAENNAKKAAYDYVAKLEKQLRQPYSAALTLAQTLAAIKNDSIKLDIDRDDVYAILDNVLSENSYYHGVFTLWEENAFDQNDENLVEANNPDGRMIPCVYRQNDGKIAFSNLKFYREKFIEDYYSIPKNDLYGAISNPLFFPVKNQIDTVVTFTSPIIYKNFFLGVVGINIKLSHFQKNIEETEFYDGQAKISIISNNGTFIASTMTDSLTMQNIERFYTNEEYVERLSVIQNGFFQTLIQNDYFVINTPLKVTSVTLPWQVQLFIPQKTLEKQTRINIFNVVIIGILAILLVSIFVAWYLKTLFVPMQKIVAATKSIAVGNLHVEMDESRFNEIGLIGQALGELINSLRNLTHISNSIAEGDFSKNVQPNSDKDELAIAINKMNQNLKKADEENELRRKEASLRNWMSQGIAELGELLRKNTNDIDSLSIEILQQIVNHLNAAQGGLFIINDSDSDNVYLELVGAFAYDRKRFFERKIMLGEGLVGMCAKEQNTVYLEKIPDNYIKLASGLGESNPRSLLIVPLKMENKTLGIIEISSFNKFKKHEIEFIERAAESMALTISTIKVNERTAFLLAQSQEQADELVLQEKEMRQNLQELNQTQEESQKREAEMRGVLKALNVSSLVAEYDMSGKLLGINDAFLKLFNIQRSQAIGKSIQKLGFINSKTDNFEKVWGDLRLGKNVKSHEDFLKFANGNEFWLSQTFTPILNEQGETYKILVVAMDISKLKKQEIELLKTAELLKKQTHEFTIRNERKRATLKAIDQVFIRGEYSNEGIMMKLNDNYVRMSGHNRTKIEGKNLFDFIYGNEKKRFMKIWQGLLVGKSQTIVSERVGKLGKKIWIKASYVPTIDSNGDVSKIDVIAIDITEYKEFERQTLLRIEGLENVIKQYEEDV